MNHNSYLYNIRDTSDTKNEPNLSANKANVGIFYESSTRYFFLVVTVVTSVTVTPKPSSLGSVVTWEQEQQLLPGFASYGGTELRSLIGTEDEEGRAAKSSTLTGMSSQILQGSGLPLSITWTWFRGGGRVSYRLFASVEGS
jgi:hypothetical protein